MKRQIKSSYIGPYGNKLNIDIEKLSDLKGYLQLAYDTCEEMDDETFQAIGDGESLVDDLDIYVHELQTTLNMLNERYKEQ